MLAPVLRGWVLFRGILRGFALALLVLSENEVERRLGAGQESDVLSPGLVPHFSNEGNRDNVDDRYDPELQGAFYAYRRPHACNRAGCQRGSCFGDDHA